MAKKSKPKAGIRKRDPINKADPKNIKAPVEPQAPKEVTDIREMIESMPPGELVAEKPRTIEQKPVLYLCIAENSFCNKTLEIGGMFGRGQIVDLGKLMKDGSELRTQVRINCFKPMGAGG